MTGSKTVIKEFLKAVMNSGQEVLYPNPGFPIYESQTECKQYCQRTATDRRPHQLTRGDWRSRTTNPAW